MGIKGYKHPGKKKVVVAVNPDGSVERVFDFIKDAAAYYKCDRHSITNSCRRGTVAHGFKWFYEEDFRRIYMNCEYEKLRWTPDPNRDRWTYHFKKGHKAGNGIEKWSEQRLQKARDTMRSNCLRRKEHDAEQLPPSQGTWWLRGVGEETLEALHLPERRQGVSFGKACGGILRAFTPCRERSHSSGGQGAWIEDSVEESVGEFEGGDMTITLVS